MREVLFIQCRFPTSRLELEGLLGRWEAYALKLEQVYGMTSIYVLSPFNKIEVSSKYPHLNFLCDSTNKLKNISTLFRLLKSTKGSFTLVCGDNQLSLFLSIISRIIFGKKVSIQCQFHGDLYTSSGNPGLRGLFRIASSRLAFSQADSIRIVSEFQETEIRLILPKINAKFVVSPIPIDYSKIPLKRASEISYDVAVVGRLHEERGIDQAILIIKKIVNLAKKTRVVFVGEGKYSDSIYRDLAYEIQSGSVILLGTLSSEKLRDVFASSKVLLSAAPREGYGLTLREAFLSGMVVVAKNSDGAREASRNSPKGYELFDSVDEAVYKILCILEDFSENTDRAEWVQVQKDLDEMNLRKLFESWVKA